MSNIGYTYIIDCDDPINCDFTNDNLYIITLKNLDDMHNLNIKNETINLFNYKNIDIQINKDFAEYITDKFEILHIEDIYGNKIDKIIDKKFLTYYLIKQIPIDIILSTLVKYNNFINNGIIKCYYKNGILYEEYFHINGNKQGIYKLYYSNGQIKEEGTYINNLKEGEWILYHYDGKINKKVYYFNNNEKLYE